MIRPYRGVLPRIAESAYIDPSAQIIGDVVIGERSSVWPLVAIRGDVNYIRVGNETSVQDNTVLHVDHRLYPCIIGNRVTVGHSVVLHGCVVEDGGAYRHRRHCVERRENWQRSYCCGRRTGA